MTAYRAMAVSAIILILSSNVAMADGVSLDSLYFGFGAGLDYSEFNSGGFNTLGPHENTNDDEGTSATASFFIGFDDLVTFGPVTLRAELEGNLIAGKSITTDSFAPPTPTFFYETRVRSYVGLINLWADARPFADLPVVLSAGGGTGVAHHEIRTNDTVVTGDRSDTKFAYALGVQAAYEFSPTVTAGVMGRYTDLGNPTVDLNFWRSSRWDLFSRSIRRPGDGLHPIQPWVRVIAG